MAINEYYGMSKNSKLDRVMVGEKLHDWLMMEKVKRRKNNLRETLKEIIEEAGYQVPDDD